MATQYGPGLHQKSPSLSKSRALVLLEEQYQVTIPKGKLIQSQVSIEVGDYDFKREAFPVWLHDGNPYPAQYWIDQKY